MNATASRRITFGPPMAFTAQSVVAIMDGWKTMTRRVLRLPDGLFLHDDLAWADPGLGAGGYLKLPYHHPQDACQGKDDCVDRVRSRWQIGQIVRVKEAFWLHKKYKTSPAVFDATRGVASFRNKRAPWRHERVGVSPEPEPHLSKAWKLYSAMMMPNWAGRLFLRIEDIRIERIQAITCADIRLEGVRCPEHDFPGGFCVRECPDLRRAFADGWEKLHPGGWAMNQWVAAISFKQALIGDRT